MPGAPHEYQHHEGITSVLATRADPTLIPDHMNAFFVIRIIEL